MNPFRLRMLHLLCMGGNGSRIALCEKFDKEPRILTRDLKPAVDSGLLALDEDCIFPPDDPIPRRIIELAQ